MVDFLAIIQARSGSTRLPNKCLKPLHGIPLVKRVYENACECLKHVVVAIPENDKALKDYLQDNNIPYYCGSENDVLSRYYNCALTYKAQRIGRITSDCWCLDPILISGMTGMFVSSNFSFATNRLKPYSYPEGFDYEMMTFPCLAWLNKHAKGDKYREHVTNFIYENPKEFELSGMKILNFKSKVNLSHLKLSIDTDEDFKQAEKLFVE